jgi:hypothetical protein
VRRGGLYALPLIIQNVSVGLLHVELVPLASPSCNALKVLLYVKADESCSLKNIVHKSDLKTEKKNYCIVWIWVGKIYMHCL